MLDINLFRDDKEFKRVLESEKKRGKDSIFAKDTKKYDELWREAKLEKESAKAEKNKLSKEIPIRIKENKPINDLKEKSRERDIKIKELEDREKKYLELRDDNRYKVGNILYNSVPIGSDDEDSKLIECYGVAKVQKEHIGSFKSLTDSKMKHEIMNFVPKSHADLGPKRDLFDLERAAKISGARFYYLKNKLTILHMSLLRFAMDKIVSFGYTPMYTPYIMNKDSISKAAELGDFEETLYKVGDNQFLIATAEQPLAGYHMDEILDVNNLPLKYAGISTAFRREAGSAGKDTRGIFRVHQFEKVEQYVYCEPKDSESMLEELVGNAKDIYKALEIPFRVVEICAGDMNDTAAKKYDIELWMPVQGTFREIGSYSITSDYQTRKLNVRYEDKGIREVVHSLNGTALPSPRILSAFIENHQTKDGTILIPKTLQKYTGFDKI